MNILIHDGHSTIGGNKISVCSKNGECALLDFGMNFQSWGEYFEEFINPRTGKALHDIIKLNLAPEIPIYREDLAFDNFAYDGRYKFLFISHAHADHCGLIGLISEELPIVATPETLSIVITDSEVRRSNVWNKFYGKRFIKPKDSFIRGDLKHSDRSKDALIKRTVAGIKDVDKTEFADKTEFVDINAVWDEMRIFKVYHSVIGASAIALKVDNFWVVYTGDLRSGPDKNEQAYWLESLGERRLKLSQRTKEFINEVKDLHPMVLIVEGTRVTREGGGANTTERDVFENAMELVIKHKGVVLVDYPIRHLERVLTFIRVAQESGRYFVMFPKDFLYLEDLGKFEPAWKLTEEEKKAIKIFHPGVLTYTKREKEFLKTVIDEGNLITPYDINSNPSKYILSMGYWKIPNILDFDEDVLKNSIYIHSTSEAYTEEQQIDAKRFRNWLKRFNIRPSGIEFKEDEVIFTKDFHASGHISPEALENLINTLNPEFIIPVHTLNKGWFEMRWEKKVITERNVSIE
ncbi:MAG: ribonuclease J [Thermotogaceae bacterium]|nr:ribonuclease J [Thermotogaceae bacterium]